MDDTEASLQDFIAGMRAGDFSRLAPAFEGEPALAQLWDERGALTATPDVRAEALTCACFLGKTAVAKYFLGRGIDPEAGNATGLNAFHWAANRGQLEAVRLLVGAGAPLETRSAYHGTVLGTAVWAAIHEPKPAHVPIVELLVRAGARVDDVGYPSGDPAIDALLRRYGATGA